MKLFILCVFAVSLTSSLIAAPNFSKGTPGGPGGSQVSIDLGGGLITTGGSYGGSFLAGFKVQVDRTAPVRVGLDSGILFGSGTGLPILATVTYSFSERSSRGRLYLEGLVGPVIGLGGIGVFNGLGDSVKLAILMRPGVAFAVADKLDITVDLTMGGLTGIFYVSTMLGFQLHL
jgi:hypothetical protein